MTDAEHIFFLILKINKNEVCVSSVTIVKFKW